VISEVVARLSADPRAAALAAFVGRWWWVGAIVVTALVILPRKTR
jgi:hypothetical protein